jgi:hypothetical protein
MTSKDILFIGQCKQGSNSLFTTLANQKSLTPGNDIRSMVRKHTEEQDYFDNWNEVDTANTKYLLDKSIINPDKYDYHIGNWRNHNHKMIYMVRNIYNMLKSQFLVVLAGEESYRYGIPKFGKTWDRNNFTEENAIEVIEYNKQKYTHYHNITNLPKDVFDPRKNILFTTFENFITDTDKEFDKVSNFINIDIKHDGYPRENSTQFEWYSEQTSTYKENLVLFEKYKELIYDHCIDISEWAALSDIMEIDLIKQYNIGNTNG